MLILFYWMLTADLALMKAVTQQVTTSQSDLHLRLEK